MNDSTSINNSSESPVSGKPKRIRKIRSAFFGVLLSGIGLLLIAYYFVGDRTWWGEWMTIWPPVLWAFPLLVVFVLSFDAQRRKRSALTLFLILVYIVHAYYLEGGRFWNHAPYNPPKGDIRIATWNVNSAPGGIQALAKELAFYDVDVWMFQESPDPSDVWDSLDARYLGWEKLFYHDMGDAAVLSRFPLTPLPSERVGPWESPQILKMDVPTSHTLLIVNVRLMLPSLRLNLLSKANREQMIADHQTRMQQFQNLAALIERVQSDSTFDGVVLTGDFNTPARMPTLDPLRRIGMRDVWLSAGRGWGGTMTSNYPVARIDQCWIAGEISPQMAYVNSGDYSDHLPLVVDLDFISDGSPKSAE